jgi:hypothetical protein
MSTIAGFPLFPLEIDKAGKVVKASQVEAIVDAVSKTGPGKITDLYVVSHGWNNDMADAGRLYKNLFENVAQLLQPPRADPARKFAIVGVFWPSKKFTDAELIPGGAASLGTAASGGAGAGVSAAAVKKKLDSLEGVFDRGKPAALAKAKKLVDKLETSTKAQKEFADLIRGMLPAKPRDKTDDASDKFLKMSGDRLLAKLSMAVVPVARPSGSSGGVASLSGSGAQGQAAGLGDFFSGITAGAFRLLNFATYYQMKERAGLVGVGLNGALQRVRKARPDLAMHLIGHSFGARAVTAAVDGSAALNPASLTLLQGAFSHNGFTEKFDGAHNGFFRKVIAGNKVAGPIAVTHTINDKAVGLAYPLASRLSGDNAAAIGDANDVFGGLGRNGAVKLKPNEHVVGQLLAQNGRYSFTPGKVHNLLADAFIPEHSGITGREVANLVLAVTGV